MPLDAAPDRLREVLAPAAGPRPHARRRGSATCCRGGSASYDRTWLDRAVRRGRGRLDRRRQRLRPGRARGAVLPRGRAVPGAAAGGVGEGPRGRAHDALRERLAGGAAFWSDLLVDLDESPVDLRDALWDLVWAGRGDQRRVRAAARAAPVAGAAGRSSRAAGAAFGSRRAGSQPQLQGRWSPDARPLRAAVPPRRSAPRRAPSCCSSATAWSHARRWSRERVPGGFASVYAELSALETLGSARRGYFVEGLGGAQFALSAAVERLRSHRERTAESRSCWRLRIRPTSTGPCCRGRAGRGRRAVPARVPGAYVVLLGGQRGAVRGGRAAAASCRWPTIPRSGCRRRSTRWPASCARADRCGAWPIERFDGEPVMGSAVEQLLVERGFRSGRASSS